MLNMILKWDMTIATIAYTIIEPCWTTLGFPSQYHWATGIRTSSSFIKRPQSDVSVRAESNLSAAWVTRRKWIHSWPGHIHEIFHAIPIPKSETMDCDWRNGARPWLEEAAFSIKSRRVLVSTSRQRLPAARFFYYVPSLWKRPARNQNHTPSFVLTDYVSALISLAVGFEAPWCSSQVARGKETIEYLCKEISYMYNW